MSKSRNFCAKCNLWFYVTTDNHGKCKICYPTKQEEKTNESKI